MAIPKTYARVDQGIVREIIEPSTDELGNEYPIEDRYVPQLVAQMVDVSAESPMPECGWLYDGKSFSPPSQ
ncbi:hypothetical protein LGN12_19130 [Burkholderia multivorans]|nr:hypothetical protein [Burkholderia multivorans]